MSTRFDKQRRNNKELENKGRTIFNRWSCWCWLVPWSWLWLGTLILRYWWSWPCFTFAINHMQNFVIWTKITFIWSLATQGLDLPQMILLLMIISAINGKYFLIKTSDNDTSQDYIMSSNRQMAGRCEQDSIFSRREVACKRGWVLR